MPKLMLSSEHLPDRYEFVLVYTPCPALAQPNWTVARLEKHGVWRDAHGFIVIGVTKWKRLPQ